MATGEHDEETNTMITLEGDRLVARFPEVHQDAAFSMDLQRTLRIPDDGTNYPLPPGMGSFPLRHLDDFASRVPDAWRRRGGVITPIHQAEALWLNFSSLGGSRVPYPFAIKVATGKINAVTGERWCMHLNDDPQDYLAIPEQPWLDGYCIEKGVIRQFVAMPLGSGYSVEEQITGEGAFGGIQLVVYPMKVDRYLELVAQSSQFEDREMGLYSLASPSLDELADMGLAPGGRIHQSIYDDPYGLDAWDMRHSSRCFVTLLNAEQWIDVTGTRPPTQPPSAKSYNAAGLPWFAWYGNDAAAHEGSKELSGVKSVKEFSEYLGEEPLSENESVVPDKIIGLGNRDAREPDDSVKEDGPSSAGRTTPQGLDSSFPCPLFPEHHKRHYHDDLIEALVLLGGTASRSQVLGKVLSLRSKRGEPEIQTPEQTTQQAFERHCIHSEIFCGSRNKGFFCWPQGKWSGVWGLREGIALAYIQEIWARGPKPVAAPKRRRRSLAELLLTLQQPQQAKA
jgi:hypothetical protein